MNATNMPQHLPYSSALKTNIKYSKAFWCLELPPNLKWKLSGNMTGRRALREKIVLKLQYLSKTFRSSSPQRQNGIVQSQLPLRCQSSWRASWSMKSVCYTVLAEYVSHWRAGWVRVLTNTNCSTSQSWKAPFVCSARPLRKMVQLPYCKLLVTRTCRLKGRTWGSCNSWKSLNLSNI